MKTKMNPRNWTEKDELAATLPLFHAPRAEGDDEDETLPTFDTLPLFQVES